MSNLTQQQIDALNQQAAQAAQTQQTGAYGQGLMPAGQFYYSIGNSGSSLNTVTATATGTGLGGITYAPCVPWATGTGQSEPKGPKQNLSFIKAAIRTLVEDDMNISSWCVLGLSAALTVGSLLLASAIHATWEQRTFMALWPLEVGAIAFYFMRRTKRSIMGMLENKDEG